MVNRNVQPTAQGFPNQQAPIGSDGKTSVIVQQPWYQLLQTLWQRTGGPTGSLTTPSGVMVAFGGFTPPGGWVVCDGAALSRSNFSDLFNAIGTVWGPGDGSTTFNVPDMRGRMFLGANGPYPLGTVGGSATTTQSVSQMPPHQHSIDDPGHDHTALVASSTNTAGAVAGTGVAGSTGSSTTGITINDTGGGAAMTTISPYGACLICIKI